MVGEFHSHLPHSQYYMGLVSVDFSHSHVSAGAMALKKREFHNLRQGGRTLGQYVEDFSKLARYAPDDVATDAAK